MTHPRASATTALDTVEVHDDGAFATKRIGPEEPYLSGHYPGNPVYPGVFLFDLCEKLVSQCRAIPRPFDRIDSLRFLRPMTPGDQVRIDMAIRRSAEGDVVGASFVGRSDDVAKVFTARVSYA